MSLGNKKTATCFNTTVTTRSKIITETKDNKTISLSHKQQQQPERNGLLSDLVIINLCNHDHRYHKIKENHDHDQLTHNNCNGQQKTILYGAVRKKMVDIQARGQKRKREDKIDVKGTVIPERKRKNTSNPKDGENNSARTSNTSSNPGCSEDVDKIKKVASARPETYTFKYSRGQKVLVYEPDKTKARVLYDAKVVDCINPLKDKRKRIQYTINGKKTSASIARQLTSSNRNLDSNKPEYLIHFSGWSSSWDRLVSEDTILCDTEANRNIQIDLAKKAAEHLKKNKIKLNKIPAIIKEQVLKTESAQSDNQSPSNNMNGSNHMNGNSLNCYYRDPKIYLDQALKYRHDHSYAENAINACTSDSNQKSNPDQMASVIDSDSTSQSSNGSLNTTRRLSSNHRNSSSKSVIGNSQKSNDQFTYFKLPNQFKRYLENDRKQFEERHMSQSSEISNGQWRENFIGKPKANAKGGLNNFDPSPSNAVLSVHEILDDACRHISQYTQLDSGHLNSNTVQLLMGNFDGLLKEFQDSLEIYFDVLADGDYLYYNNNEKQQYLLRSNLHSINSSHATINSSGDNEQQRTSTTSATVASNYTSDHTREADRPVNVLNVRHLIRFIVLLPEFLNATPDLTWRHQQIISFFLNQLIDYLIKNVLREEAATSKEDISNNKQSQVERASSGKARSSSVKRLSESLKDRPLSATRVFS